MSTQSESLEQPSCGVPEGYQPIFDVANCDPKVPLPTPVHGDVCDPPVPWHLLCPIEPLRPQENILQATMQLAEPQFPFFASDPTIGAAGGSCAVGRSDMSLRCGR